MRQTPGGSPGAQWDGRKPFSPGPVARGFGRVVRARYSSVEWGRHAVANGIDVNEMESRKSLSAINGPGGT
jgi:hypothetical protein